MQRTVDVYSAIYDNKILDIVANKIPKTSCFLYKDAVVGMLFIALTTMEVYCN